MQIESRDCWLLAGALAACLWAHAPTVFSQEPAPKEKTGPLEALRVEYRADADKHVFHHDVGRKHPLQMAGKPVMRWATDDDWSGDVFVWTHQGRPEVIGCILSGPSTQKRRIMYHEFHLLAERPIAAADLLTRRHWEPKEGLPTEPVAAAPEPAKTSAARLAQMRQISRDFTAHMEADGVWELRLLPQPLFRWGEKQTSADSIDGALFTYVWPKGTDPEVVLLLECRQTEKGLAWHFAPVRFSSRQVWLRYNDKEVWRVESHKEPPAESTAPSPYTTAYARTFDAPQDAPGDKE